MRRPVVLRLPNWVGDVVMAEPAASAVRDAFPSTPLLALARRHLFDLLEPGTFDELIPSRGPLADTIAVRRARPSACVLFPNSVASALPPFFAGVPRRVGYATFGRRPLLSEPLPYPHAPGGARTPVPMPRYYAALARRLGADVSRTRPRLSVRPEAAQRLQRHLAARGFENRALLALNPGASYGASKLWPPEHFARLADAVCETSDLAPVILCAPSEKHIADAVHERMRHKARTLNTAEEPLDLSELKALLARAEALVTTDTGPRHIALALDTPCVVLMGPTDPRYTDYAPPGAEIVLRRAELPCIGCHYKECPRDHACMRGITPEEALAALRSLLRRRDGQTAKT